MFHTNFDNLEESLVAVIDLMKKKELLKASKLVSANERQQTELRLQLEEEASLLNRIKNHHREIRDDPKWPKLEEQCKKLLNIRRLFTQEEQEEYTSFKAQINQLIASKLCEIDSSLNERIINRGFEKADRSHQVKIYKNWTSV